MKKLAILAILLLFLTACKTVDVDQPQTAEGIEIVITHEETTPDTGEVIQGTPTETPEETPEETPDEIPAQTTTTTSTSLGEDKCDEAAVLGFLGCLYEGEDLLITVKNTGRGDLQGVFYRFYDASYNKLGAEADMFDFNMGVEKELQVPMSNYPYTKKVDIHPVQGNDICSNQQLVVIPTTNCR